jgi:hypothetical protein
LNPGSKAMGCDGLVLVWPPKHAESWGYPLVNIQKTMENHHVHGTCHYFYGHFQ